MRRRLLVFAKPGRPGRVKTRLIGELTLGLAGPIGPDSSLGDLLLASVPTNKAGCPVGTVDAIGFQ